MLQLSERKFIGGQGMKEGYRNNDKKVSLRDVGLCLRNRHINFENADRSYNVLLFQ